MGEQAEYFLHTTLTIPSNPLPNSLIVNTYDLGHILHRTPPTQEPQGLQSRTIVEGCEQTQIAQKGKLEYNKHVGFGSDMT